MVPFVLFLVDLVLVFVAGGVAIAVGRRSTGGQLAAGLYALVTGAGLLLMPIAFWPVATTDNAFLGLYLIALIGVLLGVGLSIAAALRLRRAARPAAVAAASAASAVAASALALGWLAVRGPDPWSTAGSQVFGVDVIAGAVVLGAAAYLAGRRLEPSSA